MIEKTVKIINKNGMHMRPCGMMVDVAKTYKSDISLSKSGQDWRDAKSMMSIIMIGASCGDDVMVRANGPDENDAVSKIVEMIKDGFKEVCAKEQK